MEVLKLITGDFILTVECTGLDHAFSKAMKKQANLLRDTSYDWNIGPDNLFLYNPGRNELVEVRKGTPAHPIFFENKDYIFDIEFKEGIVAPSIYSKLREISEKFYYRKERRVLAGTVNFGNDIGRSDLIITYTFDGIKKHFEFNFEVFPTKLNFKGDYHKIIHDIEQEYPLLVLDFLKKTYTGFKTGSRETSNLIWWQVFGGLYEEFIKASKYILGRPKSRLVNETRYVKADKLKKTNPRLEEEFAHFRHIPGKLYRVQEKILSVDTPENRFFKYAVIYISNKYIKLKNLILKDYSAHVSEQFRNKLQAIEKELLSIKYSIFLKGIGHFSGLKQESLVLEKGTGYATIYKDWIMLNRGIEFLEGVQKLELKSIADLYQIWCFLEIKKILSRILNKEKPDDIELAKITADDFVFKVQTGASSRITFRQENNGIINLYHDYKYSKKAKENNKSYTVKQKPDIVLRQLKNDLRDNYWFTWLYDAKYRLESDEDPSKPDLPPDDAINQMHRYRDAIYYKDQNKKKPEKEVIGGYILFPGAGTVESIENSPYFRSIEDVNIGAFPLKPYDMENRRFLEEHLRNILELDSENILNDVIPHKDNVYEQVNPEVLVGVVPTGEQEMLLEEPTPLYYTGKNKPTRFGHKNLHFFAPHIPGKGIREYYEIIEYKSLQRNEIFEYGHPLHNADDDSERIVINLGKRHLIQKGKYFHLDGPIRVYRYLKLSELKGLVR